MSYKHKCDMFEFQRPFAENQFVFYCKRAHSQQSFFLFALKTKMPFYSWIPGSMDRMVETGWIYSSFHVFGIIIIVWCVWLFCPCVCLCATVCPRRIGEGIWYPGAEFTDGCELPCEFWKLNLGPLKDQQVI